MNDSKIKLDEIAVLWGQNIASSKIASQLGMTKGAVCGMMFRARQGGDLRFPARPPVFGPRPSKGDKPVAVNPDFIPDLSHLMMKAPPAPKGKRGSVALMDLRASDCRYPTNSGESRGDHLFCGAPKDPKSRAYCTKHHALCVSAVVYAKRRVAA